jgi:hypothetical protein
MRIKYNVTIDDLVAFNQFFHKHSAYGRHNKRTWGIIFPLCLFFFFCLIGVSQMDWVAPVVGGVLAVFIIWCNASGGWTKRIARTVCKMYEEGSNKSVFGLHELELPHYMYFFFLSILFWHLFHLHQKNLLQFCYRFLVR